jgi:hypothetical protein
MNRFLSLSLLTLSLLSIAAVRPFHWAIAEGAVESGEEGPESGESSEGSGEIPGDTHEAGEGTEGGSENEGEGNEGAEGSEGSEGEGAEGGSEGSEGEEGEEGEQEPEPGSQPMIDAGLLSQIEDWYVTAHQIARIQIDKGADAGLKALGQQITAGWASKVSSLGVIFANLGLDLVEPGEVVTFQPIIQDLSATTEAAAVDAKARAALQSALDQGIAFAGSKVGEIQDAAARGAAQQMISEWQAFRDQLSGL